jgi:hypothetical protein
MRWILQRVMVCARCGHPTTEGDAFCPNCGQPLAPVVPERELAGPSGPIAAPLTSAAHLEMFWDSSGEGLQIQDGAGRPLGATSGQLMGVGNGITLFDTSQLSLNDTGRPVILAVRSPQMRGIHLLQFQIFDAAGGLLATLRQKPAFGSQKLGIMVGPREVMTLVFTRSSFGARLHIEEVGTGNALATAEQKGWSRASRMEVDIPESRIWDRRILLGSLIAAEYF